MSIDYNYAATFKLYFDCTQSTTLFNLESKFITINPILEKHIIKFHLQKTSSIYFQVIKFQSCQNSRSKHKFIHKSPDINICPIYILPPPD